jgi:hypothetical protein
LPASHRSGADIKISWRLIQSDDAEAGQPPASCTSAQDREASVDIDSRFQPYLAPATLAAADSLRPRARAKYTLGGYGLVAALLLLALFLHDTSTRAATVPLHPLCSGWDEKAADTIAQLLHEPADAALRQAGDALFRLRRARRTCRAGWLALSCQDYRAIVRLRNGGGNEAPVAKTLCLLATME